MHVAESVASAKAQLDWHCSFKSKTGIFLNNTLRTNTATMLSEQWYELYVIPWHSELAGEGMRVLA